MNKSDNKKLKYINFFESEFAKKSRFHWDFISDYEEKERWNYLALQYQNNKIIKSAEKSNKIPKIIHQIWIGPKRLPNKYKKWMSSWKLFNPDWQYIFWDNKKIMELDIIHSKAYKQINNYGFKSDLLRYEILKKYGGLYVDTDFECIKKLPGYLLEFNFVSGVVFDNAPIINNAMILTKPNSLIINRLLKEITLNNSLKELSVFEASGPLLLTKIYFNLNESEKKKCLITPSNYFYPFPHFLLEKNLDIKKFISKDSIGIHHWERSWFMKPIFIKILLKLIDYVKHFIKFFLIKLKML